MDDLIHVIRMIDESPDKVLHQIFNSDYPLCVIEQVVAVSFYLGKGGYDKVPEDIFPVVGHSSPGKKLR